MNPWIVIGILRDPIIIKRVDVTSSITPAVKNPKTTLEI
jgi:hypothetical protein